MLSRQTVITLASNGVPIETMALLLRVNKRTLWKHYRAEFGRRLAVEAWRAGVKED